MKVIDILDEVATKEYFVETLSSWAGHFDPSMIDQADLLWDRIIILWDPNTPIEELVPQCKCGGGK